MGYIGDGPKPELEVGDISTKDVTATGDLTVDTNTLFVDSTNNNVLVGGTTFDNGGLSSNANGINVFDATAPIVNVIETSGNTSFFLGKTASDCFIATADAQPIRFHTNDAERMRIDSAGHVGIGTTSPQGDGIHIVAPDSGTGLVLSGTSATAGTEVRLSALNEATTAWHNLNVGGNNIIFRAAGTERARITTSGLTFNGDTAAANALDDYEEGTWTPTIAQGWTSVSYTNSYQFGNYTKIGNMVTAWFWLQFSGTSAGNQVLIGGLPFTTPDQSNIELAHRGGAVTYFSAPVNAAGAITAYTVGGGTQIQFYAFDDGGASALSNANASGDYLIGSVTYWVE